MIALLLLPILMFGVPILVTAVLGVIATAAQTHNDKRNSAVKAEDARVRDLLENKVDWTAEFQELKNQ